MTLREAGLTGLRRGRPQDVGFGELFGQPRSFRGRLVRIKGTLHRLERLAAPANDYAIGDYWQGWLEPAGGPPSPVVVQCLTLPAGHAERHGASPSRSRSSAISSRTTPTTPPTRSAWPRSIMSVGARAAAPLAPAVGAGSSAREACTLVVAATLAAVDRPRHGSGWRAGGGPTRGRAVPAATGLDDSLAGLEPFSVEESLRRIAAAQGGRETTRGAGEPDA